MKRNTRKFGLALTALTLVALLLAVFGAVPAWAADWYVDGSVGASGDGSSWAAAFKTIQEGVNTANAAGGDTTNVAAGVYKEEVTIGKSVTLQGAKKGVDPRGGARTEGDASESVIDGESTRDHGIYIKGADDANRVTNVVIDGFEIHHATYANIRLDYANDVTVKNTMVHHCGTNEGIKTKASCDSLTFQYVISHDNVGDGMELGGYGTHTNHAVLDCDLYDNEDRGLYLDKVDNCRAERCRMYGNQGTVGNEWHQGGIIVYRSTRTTLIDNECYNNAGAGIHLYKENYPGALTSSQVTGGKCYNNTAGAGGTAPGDGLRLYLSSNVTMDGVECYGNARNGVNIGNTGRYGLYAADPCDNNVVTNCNLHDNTGAGMAFDSVGPDGCQVYGNTLTGNWPNGLDDSEAATNLWDNDIDTGNNWADFSANSGYPDHYNVPGSASSVDRYPTGYIKGPYADIYVDAVNGDDGNTGYDADHAKKTIQAGIDAVSGSTVYVAAGTYDEQVVIDKSLTLQGESKENTIIDGSGYNPVIRIKANDVTVKTLKIVGKDASNWYGINIGIGYAPEPSTVGIRIEDCDVSSGRGIWLFNAVNNIITGNTIHDCYDYGIWLYQGADGNQITDNIIKFNGLGILEADGCEGEPNIYASNRFEDNALGGGGGSEGEGLAMYFANDIVESNTFINNRAGIWLYQPHSDFKINYNNFEGNTQYGVELFAGGPIDATNNWWGDATGPSGEGPGTGDAVSTNVHFDPWLTAPYQPTTPMTSFVVDDVKFDCKKENNDDKVRVKGELELATTRDISEDVTVTVGPLSETIRMVEKGKKGDKWEYKRPKGGAGDIKHMTIDWKNGKFDIRMDKADLSGLTDPNNVTISVQIGDDVGEETIPMREKKHHWDYKAEKPKKTGPAAIELLVTTDEVKVVAYPNPIRDVDTATFQVMGTLATQVEEIRVQIYDLSGRLVWKDTALGSELDWHTDSLSGDYLANGIYLYSVQVRIGGNWINQDTGKIAVLR